MMNLFGETPVRKLLTLHALSGETLVEETATPGNPCTFETDVAKALTQCKVLFTPVQSGSGDPSPDNVRPITGFTGIHVYHSGEYETDYDTYAVDWTSSGTKYGGNIDLITGVLTVEWKKEELKDLNWFNFSGMTTFQAEIHKDKNTHVLCDCFPTKNGNPTVDQQIGEYANGASYASSLLFYKTGMTSVQELNNWFAALDYPASIVFKMDEPITIQLTAQQITALIGENNLWSDANGNLEVKYMKKG